MDSGVDNGAAEELESSGLVDAASAQGWGDLPDDHWQNQALAATTEVAGDDRIVVASREPDTDEFIYVRCRPEWAVGLRDQLSTALDTFASESGGPPRKVYLDPRITAEAAGVLVGGRQATLHDDRFFLNLDEFDRGHVCVWTDVEGELQEKIIIDDVFEITDEVRDRARQITAAVLT